MTKTAKYLLVTAGLLFLALKTKAMTKNSGFTAFKDPTRAKLLVIADSLENNGLTQPQLNFALAQMLFETGSFTSKSQVATLNNNFSGIMWINKPYQVNAVKGSARPASEGGYYARFNTIQDWANDYIRILNLKSKPIEAVNVYDFVKRLAVNNYFDATRPNAEKNYLNGIVKYLNLLTV